MSYQEDYPRGSLASLRSTTYVSPRTPVTRQGSVEVKREKIVVEHDMYGMAGSVGALIVWFVVVFILAWLVLYALKPSIVMKRGGREVDTGKVLLGAAIIALVVIIITWLIKSCVTKRY